MATPVLEMVIGAIIEMGVEGVWETAKRREKVLDILKRLGFDLREPPADFNGLYAYTLVEYGAGKPEQIIDLFRHEIIKDAFRRAFEQQSRDVFDTEIEAFLGSDIGRSFYQLDYNPKQELVRFQAVFNELTGRARTVPEVRQDQKLEDIHRAVEQVLDSLQDFSARKSSEGLHKVERLTGAELVLRMAISRNLQPLRRNWWSRLQLNVAVTSNNAICSDNGALKLMVARPVVFSEYTIRTFPEAYFELSTGLPLPGYDDVPHAQSMKICWGATQGTVIFPGDWHNFYGKPFFLEVPDLSLLPNPTYLLSAELFTVNSPPKGIYYSIQRDAEGDFGIDRVGPGDYDSRAESFWATYHSAREKLNN